jgi:methionyl aminopeptidase
VSRSKQDKRRLARRRAASEPRPGSVRHARVRPGTISPERAVPDHIARPPYARAAGALAPTVPPGEFVARMRAAGKAARRVLLTVGDAVTAGVTTDDLDAIAHDACIAQGGYPSPLRYKGFPKSICTSVNDIICHGIPDNRKLLDGDIVNVDVTVYLNGVHGDTNATFCVGNVSPLARELVDVTRECMWRGIRAIQPGVPLNAIGKEIESLAHEHDFGVVRMFVGHGIGEEFHTSPSVPHYYDPGERTVISAGMTFTVEPMITAGSYEVGRLWRDGWTAPTADGSLSAQFEHTLLVTPTGAEVLTLLDDEQPAF